ncbi:hypothetical protein RND81_03G045800 [Saponaria officinalis]|uniref:Transposase n=1 Tax=Saponaria officinalis TaxID=3572 RepID=A0AAW1M3B7_SAPOF
MLMFDKLAGTMAKARSLRINLKSRERTDQTILDAENELLNFLLSKVWKYIDADGKRTRGKTVMPNVWNLPEGHRIVVEINKSNQPIRDEGGVLGHFCGTIVRNGGLCSLSYTRWDYLKKGNKGNNQTLILNEVQERFFYPKILEKWILKSIGHKWRDYKCYLKGIHYSDDANITELHNNCPDDVVQDQWISLGNFWRSDEGQDRIKEIAAEQEQSEMNINDDPVAQVLGKDQYGRVRGFSLGVKPSDLMEPYGGNLTSGLNMSTKEETTSIYLIRQLKEQMQLLEKHIVKQGKTINKLKRKIWNNDRNSSDLDHSEYISGESSSEGDYDIDNIENKVEDGRRKRLHYRRGDSGEERCRKTPMKVVVKLTGKEEKREI